MNKTKQPNLRRWRDFRIKAINEASGFASADTSDDVLKQVEKALAELSDRVGDARKSVSGNKMPSNATKRDIIKWARKIIEVADNL